MVASGIGAVLFLLILLLNGSTMDKKKKPYLFSAIEQSLVFAGLWDYWTNGVEHILSCAIITTPSSPEFESYHSRMPVMLTTDHAELWLDEKQKTAELYPLFKSVLPYRIQAVVVDSQVGYSSDKSEPILVGKKFYFIEDLKNSVKLARHLAAHDRFWDSCRKKSIRCEADQ